MIVPVASQITSALGSIAPCINCLTSATGLNGGGWGPPPHPNETMAPSARSITMVRMGCNYRMHRIVIGHWSLVVGHWSLVVGHWSLVIGRWSLVVGHWSLVRRTTKDQR